MSRFTAEEALDLRGTPDAIRLSLASVNRICDQHSADPKEFFDDHYPNRLPSQVISPDAGDLFAWLGY